MFKKLQALKQRKAEKVAEMRAIVETQKEGEALPKEKAEQFENLKKLVGEIQEEIDRVEAVADAERQAEGEGKTEDKRHAKIDDVELRHWIKTGELRSLSTNGDNGKDGGYSVIPQLDKEVMTRLTDDSVMRQIANVVRLPVGAKTYKKLVSAGGATIGRGVEGVARGETATPKMNEVSIELNPIYAYPKTTQEILDFGGVDILGWLTDEISESFAETEEADLTAGTGEKQSKGFLTYPRTAEADKVRAFGKLQKMEVSAAKLSADNLIDLLFSLHSKYRKNAVWVMNSQTAGTLQKLKNGNGDYIWRDGLQVGSPATLLGLPVYYLETMPNAEAGQPFIAVGDFKRGYTIVDHETGVRTRPDNLTEAGFYKIHTDKYLGGGVVDSNAIKVLECKA
ncbi:capsid protein [Haemophilus paracuniculus]|uniref:Capsid protein n=1 Tax=Haemophilus paracuniculus TaxID=734 RepID=A0A1T0AT32_9PAST|nr:phage major capsid protein [Haemophilus paracuniculus]OOR99348.1 capsid protein [Haemophilus paracuniculus]